MSIQSIDEKAQLNAFVLMTNAFVLEATKDSKLFNNKLLRYIPKNIIAIYGHSLMKRAIPLSKKYDCTAEVAAKYLFKSDALQAYGRIGASFIFTSFFIIFFGLFTLTPLLFIPGMLCTFVFMYCMVKQMQDLDYLDGMQFQDFLANARQPGDCKNKN